jgi:hypothetical protein
MSSLSFRRAAVALALGSILLSPWASASELRSRAHRSGSSVTQEVQGVFGQVWGILTGLLNKNGGSIDPFGALGSHPTTSSSAGFCENGMSIDPNGRCVSQTATTNSSTVCENGGSIDPNGRCVIGH